MSEREKIRYHFCLDSLVPVSSTNQIIRKVYDTYRGQNALSERHTLAIIARLEEELGRLCVPVSVGLGSKDLWVVISIMVFYNDNASIKYDRRTI